MLIPGTSASFEQGQPPVGKKPLQRVLLLADRVPRLADPRGKLPCRRGWQWINRRRHSGLLGEPQQRRRPAGVDEHRRTVEGLRAAKNARHRVVITLRNRVVLVVVTPSARNRQSEKSQRRRVDLLINCIEFKLQPAPLVESPRANRQEPGSDSLSSGVSGCFGRQEISRKLLPHELIPWHIAVEGIDDIVAIPPGMGIGEVHRSAGALGITGNVQPMTGPLLTKM